MAGGAGDGVGPGEGTSGAAASMADVGVGVRGVVEEHDAAPSEAASNVAPVSRRVKRSAAIGTSLGPTQTRSKRLRGFGPWGV